MTEPTDAALRARILELAETLGWPAVAFTCPVSLLPHDVQHDGEDSWRDSTADDDTAHLAALLDALEARAEETA